MAAEKRDTSTKPSRATVVVPEHVATEMQHLLKVHGLPGVAALIGVSRQTALSLAVPGVAVHAGTLALFAMRATSAA